MIKKFLPILLLAVTVNAYISMNGSNGITIGTIPGGPVLTTLDGPIGKQVGGLGDQLGLNVVGDLEVGIMDTVKPLAGGLLGGSSGGQAGAAQGAAGNAASASASESAAAGQAGMVSAAQQASGQGAGGGLAASGLASAAQSALTQGDGNANAAQMLSSGDAVNMSL